MTIAMSSFSSSLSKSDGIIDKFAILLSSKMLPRFQMESASSSIVLSANKARKFSTADRVFRTQYFDDRSIYYKLDFERRFGMLRSVCARIYNALNVRSVLKRQQDALDKPSTTLLVRIIASLRTLAYRKSFDKVDKTCEIFAPSSRASSHAFILKVVSRYGEKYLQALNAEDLKRILSINAARGCPGCVGSWGCQYWPRKNCPAAWDRQFKRKSIPTVVLEAVVDAKLLIQACHFDKL